MKNSFVNCSYNYIIRHKKLDHYNKVKIKYGLEVMYSFVTKTVAIIIMSALLGFLIENLFVFLFYGILRTFSHGVHAKTSRHCWISTLCTYFLTGLFCKYISFPKYIMYIISLISFLTIIIYAPADTIYRPIRSKEKRLALKLKASVASFLYIIIIIFVNFSYKNSIIVSFILCVISINPITYKVLKTPQNNYKDYSGVLENMKERSWI